jgi:hypothetical protein
MGVADLQERYVTEPRRADGRRSWETCDCASRMSLFFSRPASYSRSGWRKPAVGYHPIVRGERNHSRKTDRHCRCGFRCHGGLTVRRCWFGARYWPKIVRCAPQARSVSEPRRAHARRSCRTCVCAPRMSLFFSGLASRTRSGWRKSAVVHHPIARGEPNHSTKTDRHCRCDSRTTAG